MSTPDQTQQAIDVPQPVVDYLASEKTMTLATSTPTGVPYATTFLYVNDGPTIYFWSRSNTTAARHIAQNPMVAFAVETYSGDLRHIRGVQGTGECSVLLSGIEIARVAELFGQRFPDLQPGTTMSISFFRIVPTNINYLDNTEEGAAAAAGAFGAEFHKQRAFSIFTGLPVQGAETIVSEMRTVHHAAGDTIVRAGGPADKFLVVVEGEVDSFAEDGSQPPMVLGPGRFYGEIAILRDTPRVSTLKARTDVTLLTMERDAFRDLVAQSLGTTADFDQIIAARLQALAAVGSTTE
jgi:uncharacterized protein YhbP (UPF0306 family)